MAAKLTAIQQAAEAAPRAEAQEFVERGEEAASRIDLDEADTRG